MPSRIDPTVPEQGRPVSKAAQRANWRAAKAELEHGGFFVPSADVLRQHTVASRLDKAIYAREFGVLGDGGDYTEQLQAALDAAEGKTLILEGISRVRTGLYIRPNCSVRGLGAATLKFPEDLSSWGTGSLINIMKVDNVRIEQIEIDGEHGRFPDHDSAISALTIALSSHVNIDSCFIHDLRAPDLPDFWATGINIRQSRNVWIRGNVIHNPQRNCISLWSPEDPPNQNIYIIANSLSASRVRNLILVSSPIGVVGSNVIISENQMSDSDVREALRLSGEFNSVIVGNLFRNNIRGIRMNPLTKQNSLISNNYFENSSEYHIELQANGRYFSSLQITSNFMTNAGSDGIRLQPGAVEQSGSEITLIDVKNNTLVNGSGMDFQSYSGIGPLAFRLSVLGNSILNPRQVGLSIAQIDRPLVMGNRFDGRGESAIFLLDSDRPIVKDNQVSGNWRQGPLMFEGLSNEILRDNQV